MGPKGFGVADVPEIRRNSNNTHEAGKGIPYLSRSSGGDGSRTPILFYPPPPPSPTRKKIFGEGKYMLESSTIRRRDEKIRCKGMHAKQQHGDCGGSDVGEGAPEYASRPTLSIRSYLLSKYSHKQGCNRRHIPVLLPTGFQAAWANTVLGMAHMLLTRGSQVRLPFPRHQHRGSFKNRILENSCKSLTFT